jgi:hypothetical protein
MIPGAIRQKWRQELCSSRSGWRNQSVWLHARVRSRFRLKANASLFVLTVAGLEFGIKPMRRSIIFRIALLSLGLLAGKDAEAGSAVAIGSNGHLVASVAPSVDQAKQRAIDICIRQGGVNVRILAASDIVGYGAIAFGRRGSGYLTGVALGKRSPIEAEILAIDACRKAGCSNPKIKREFKG